MAELSDHQLAGLLDEIAAAMKVDMPIADAMDRLRNRRLGVVAVSAGKIADAMAGGQSAEQALLACDSRLAEQASAAVRTAGDSGDPQALARFSSLLRWRAEYRRNSRIAWLYPLMLLAIAYATLVIVVVPMVLRYQGRDFAWSETLLALCRWLDTNWLVPPIILLVFILLAVIWRYTHRSLPHDASRRLFCQSLADQLNAGVSESEAIANAAALAGEEELATNTGLTFKSVEIAYLLAEVDSPLLEIPNASEQQTLIAKLKYLAAIHSERARRNEYLWARLGPRIAMVLVGGGFALSYVVWVIAPVYLQVARW